MVFIKIIKIVASKQFMTSIAYIILLNISSGCGINTLKFFFSNWSNWDQICTL